MNAPQKHLALMAAIMLAGTDYYGQKDKYNNQRQETPEEIKEKQEKIKQKQGLRQFRIFGVEIYALNYKNAVKKYKKLKR